MIEFAGIAYKLDLNAFSKAIEVEGQKHTDILSEKVFKEHLNELNGLQTTEITTNETLRGVTIDSTKYELLRFLIDMIIDEELHDSPDESLGIDRFMSKKSFGYRLAFNTLLDNKIIVGEE
jgi:hypothetical protein